MKNLSKIKSPVSAGIGIQIWVCVIPDSTFFSTSTCCFLNGWMRFTPPLPGMPVKSWAHYTENGWGLLSLRWWGRERPERKVGDEQKAVGVLSFHMTHGALGTADIVRSLSEGNGKQWWRPGATFTIWMWMEKWLDERVCFSRETFKESSGRQVVTREFHNLLIAVKLNGILQS